ncbi:MAG TPA: hypothetical protein VNZ49_09275 [Bacteroidia bacterium]|jgi:hypothetical protein|nr:hypothetical protein [Bacteroidia bacterium]
MSNLENKTLQYIYYLAFVFLMGCVNSDKKIKDISIKYAGNDIYSETFEKANDTLTSWKLNNLYGSNDSTFNTTCLDSLLCFNTSKNRFISALLSRTTVKNASMDGLVFFYGEKINNQWYFFRGASIVIPRSMVKGHDISKPLSYEQLHEIALKEVYSGYLTSKGEINEEWFAKHFEGPTWGDFNRQGDLDWALKGKRFTNRKDYYEYFHLKAAIGIWETRDTTQPIKTLKKEKVLP